MLKGRALVLNVLYQLQNQYKWELQTGANAPISTSVYILIGYVIGLIH
jgi:hypothetical protein